MQPEMPAMPPSPEMGPAQRGGETTPQFTSEQQPQRQPEQSPVHSETRETLPPPVSGGGGDSTFQSAAPVLPPPPVLAPDPLANADPVSTDAPATAADEDLIEKEWVDKAKKIISTTKNDPYEQEKEVSKLQADYLKKRYGKEVQLPVE